MEKHGIIPDLIDKVPPLVLSVHYNAEKVHLGNELTPTQVKNPPTVSWPADPAKFYTLCLTDPDAPTRANPIFREFHHWLVGNIPGNKVSEGETLSEYICSAPGQDTGLHRYTFLVYEQSGKMEFDETRLKSTSAQNRREFSIRKFAEKYKLGDAIACNFYQAQWDDYVPMVREQLGLK